MGPTARDFCAAFGRGIDHRHIVTVDVDGVAHAAIQGQYDLIKERWTLIDGQQAEIKRLRQMVEGD